ncbi:MAG TPA: DUF3667 domain-containing protein [Arenimonas sp.]|nr:DUF3667 domain-containing protein [Arenimonas sp.]
MSEAVPVGEACRNCGHVPVGNFCPQCGQRRMDDAQRRLPHLLAQFFEAATDLDGRFWRSLRALLLQPGRLTREYIEGRRARWIAPMALFLLVNVAFFVGSPVSDLNLGLYEQLSYQFYSPWARELVDARLTLRGIEFDAYAAAYSDAGKDVAKAIVLLHVPAMALFWQLLFFDRRLYYAEHFVAALHAGAFIMGMALVLMWLVRPLLQLMHEALGTVQPGGRVMTPMLIALVLWCFFRVARVVYQVPYWRVVLSLPLMFAALVLSHLGYRLVQFLVVFALT